MKNTVDVIKSRIDETEDGISELEDKVEKKFPERARKGNKTQKNQGWVKGTAGQHEM